MLIKSKNQAIFTLKSQNVFEKNLAGVSLSLKEGDKGEHLDNACDYPLYASVIWNDEIKSYLHESHIELPTSSNFDLSF